MSYYPIISILEIYFMYILYKNIFFLQCNGTFATAINYGTKANVCCPAYAIDCKGVCGGGKQYTYLLPTEIYLNMYWMMRYTKTHTLYFFFITICYKLKTLTYLMIDCKSRCQSR